jgi:hypothetical protein
MRNVLALMALVFLPACATLRAEGLGGGERTRLWRDAHDAYSRDSVRVAAAAFQRLAAQYPRTHEGHEARFYLGVLALDPRSPADLGAARQQLQQYVAADTARAVRGYHGREAATLVRLVTELQRACESRAPGLGCDTRVVTRTTPSEPAPAAPAPSNDGAAATAEAARLRRELNERDQTIRELREELQRIRNTLAPRRPQP